MANPDFVDESVSDQTGAGPFTVFMPAAWAANQIALLFIATDGGVPTLTTANGFVIATDPNGNAASVSTNGGASGANDCGMFVFWKRLVGSTTTTDPAPVVDAAASWGGTNATLHINTYSNCRTTGVPFHIIATATTGSTASITSVPVTPTLNGCTLVTCVASANDDSAFNAWTFAGSASPAGQLDNGWHGGGGNGSSFCGGRAGYATTGGSRTGTSSFGAASKQALVTLVLASLSELSAVDEDRGVVPVQQRILVPAPPNTGIGWDEMGFSGTPTIDDDPPAPPLAVPPAAPPVPLVAAADDPTPPSSLVDDDSANPVPPPAIAPQRLGPSSFEDEVAAPAASVIDDDLAPASGATLRTPNLVGTVGSDEVPTASAATVIDDDGVPVIKMSWLPGSPVPPSVIEDAIGTAATGSTTGSILGGGDIQRSFQAPPQNGTLTTIAPIPSWAASTAYVIDPTAAGINRVKNSGNLYQCSTAGTSAGSGGPSGTGTNIVDSSVHWYFVGPVLDMNTVAGDQVLAAVMRGDQTLTPGGNIDPTDNDSGAFTVISNNEYLTFTNSFAGVWRRSAAANDKVNYTVSAQFGGSGGAGDELSAAWVRLSGVKVGAPHTFSHVERASPTGGTVTAASITTTVPCLIVSFWFGNGTVQPAGSPDTAAPAGGLTLAANASAPLSLTTAGYVQHMVGWRLAAAGTSAEVWTSTTSEGAQLVTVAYELLSSSGSSVVDPDDPVPSPIVSRVDPRPLWVRSAATDEVTSQAFVDDDSPSLWAVSVAPATSLAWIAQDDSGTPLLDDDSPTVLLAPWSPRSPGTPAPFSMDEFVLLFGSGSIGDGGDTSGGAGTVELLGVGAITLGDDTLSGVGVLPLSGSAAITLGDDTSTGAGSVPLTGSASITLGDDSLSSLSVIGLFGVADNALGDDTSSGTGEIPLTGSAAIVLGEDTVLATGSLGPLPATSGSAAIVLGDDTLAATDTTSPPPAPTFVAGSTLSGQGPRRLPAEHLLVRIEDVDRGVRNWFDRVVDAHVTTPQGDRRKVSVKFSAGERWVAAADRQGIRDRDGRLILPVIQVSRTGIDVTTEMVALGSNVPRLQIARLVSDKSTNLANLDSSRPISDRRLRAGSVYDVYTIPFPTTNVLRYQVTAQCQYQTHANELIEKVFSRLEFYDVPSFVISLTGDDRDKANPTGRGSTELEPEFRSPYGSRRPLSRFYVVGYIEGDIGSAGNLEEFTDQERILQLKFNFRVPAALILDPEGERPNVQVERTAFRVELNDERVHFVDDPRELDRIFGRKK